MLVEVFAEVAALGEAQAGEGLVEAAEEAGVRAVEVETERGEGGRSGNEEALPRMLGGVDIGEGRRSSSGRRRLALREAKKAERRLAGWFEASENLERISLRASKVFRGIGVVSVVGERERWSRVRRSDRAGKL